MLIILPFFYRILFNSRVHLRVPLSEILLRHLLFSGLNIILRDFTNTILNVRILFYLSIWTTSYRYAIYRSTLSTFYELTRPMQVPNFPLATATHENSILRLTSLRQITLKTNKRMGVSRYHLDGITFLADSLPL